MAELLVVVAVIGILAAVAIPNLSAITSSSHYAKNERNAQEVANLAAAARAAGATNVWNSLDDVFDDLSNSVTVSMPGSPEPLSFRLSGFTQADREAMVPYLDLRNGTVYYKTAAN